MATNERIIEEFEDGDWIVVLDGPILEAFYKGITPTNRRHVKHATIAFASSRKGDITHMIISRKGGGEGDRIEVTPADKGRVNALIAAAVERGGTPDPG